MTDENTLPDEGGEQNPAQDQGAWGSLTTSGELDVVKAEDSSDEPEEQE